MSTFSGTLIKVDETQFVSAKFKKREFVVGTNDKYPQYVTFVAIQEKCEMLDFANTGDQIQVGYKLAGRKWESPNGQIKYFNTIEATQIHVTKSNQILDEQDMTDDEIMNDLFGDSPSPSKKSTPISDDDLPWDILD